MAKNTKKASKKSDSEGGAEHTAPAFPYSNKPNSLRKFLEMVPNKPKPSKVNADTLKAWGLRDTNDTTIIRVLKALGLVSSNNEPTSAWTEFMAPTTGPVVLAAAIRRIWAPMFESSHNPHKEDDATLRRYFNIHSGGSESTIAYQIQTFKAACDHADFGSTIAAPQGGQAAGVSGGLAPPAAGVGTVAPIHIDLHIHLPENKSRRDYEYMFEDIARHLFGRNTEERGSSGN